MNVVLYSTGCPRCKILKSKLDKKNALVKILENRIQRVNVIVDDTLK